MAQRLYSLWRRKHGEKRWERISPYAAPKEVAIRIFQSRLIDSALGGTPGYVCELRPVKEVK